MVSVDSGGVAVQGSRLAAVAVYCCDKELDGRRTRFCSLRLSALIARNRWVERWGLCSPASGSDERNRHQRGHRDTTKLNHG